MPSKFGGTPLEDDGLRVEGKSPFQEATSSRFGGTSIEDIVQKYNDGTLSPEAKLAAEELHRRETINLTPEWMGDNPNLAGLFGAGKALWEQAVKPSIEVGGAVGGAIVGAPLAVETAGMSSVAGAGLGYGIMKQFTGFIDDLLEKAEGLDPETQALFERSKDALNDVMAGAAFEMGGQATVPVITKTAQVAGKAIKPILGRLSGLGTESATQAIKSGTDTGLKELNALKSSTQFDKALRGEITGEEVVQNAKSALERIKDARGAAYRAKLDKIKMDDSVLNVIKQDLESEMMKSISRENYDIIATSGKTGPEFDFSNSTIIESQPVVKKALEDIAGWTENTASGLDILKKRLGTYVSQAKRGTPAEALLTRLKNNLSNGLKNNVPEYAEMAKGYGDVTNVIKDLESGLMLRKQGMTGRIVADQTLRRLMSSMKDNFALRKELVETLSTKGSVELGGQIAGYGMRSVLPVGLGGTAPVLIGEVALAEIVSPKLWPVLLASSPRVQGEFLRLYGKAFAETTKVSPAIARSLAYSFKNYTEESKKPKKQIGENK